MGSEMKKVENRIYDAILITIGSVSVSMASRKLLKMPLSTPESLNGTVKLAVAVSASSVLVGWLQDKNYIPVNRFK